MPWSYSSLMSERQSFCFQALQSDSNISVLCKSYGISRKSGYKWLKRFKEFGVEGLADRSRQPHRSPGQIDVETEHSVIALKKRRPQWGARLLHSLMVNHDLMDPVPSLSTVSRILKRNNLTEPKAERYKVDSFERPTPNDLWQMDLKDAPRMSDGSKWYFVGILDDHSRYVLDVTLVPDRRDVSTLDVWIAAARKNGLPNETLTDHGVQFRGEDKNTSAFRVYLWSCGVSHLQGRVRHPQTQGKIERFWKTLNHELLSRHSYHDANSWQECVTDWLDEYNNLRPHQGVDDKPPSTRYRKSDISFADPDRLARIGSPDSVFRKVSGKGEIRLNGRTFIIGRGFRGWMVELQPHGSSWQVYFRNRFVKELSMLN